MLLLNLATLSSFNKWGYIMKTTNKILIGLVIMALVDIFIPVPIAAFMLIYVLYQKPVWFNNMVEEVYQK